MWKHLVSYRLKEKAFLWWSIHADKLNNFNEFIEAFKSEFSGFNFLQYAISKLRTEGYYSHRQGTIISYITNLLKLAKATNVTSNENELTKLISTHFSRVVRETVHIRDFQTINELITYIDNISDKNLVYKESLDRRAQHQNENNKPKFNYHNNYNKDAPNRQYHRGNAQSNNNSYNNSAPQRLQSINQPNRVARSDTNPSSPHINSVVRANQPSTSFIDSNSSNAIVNSGNNL